MNLKLKNINCGFSPLVKALFAVVILTLGFSHNVLSQAISVDEANTNQEVRDLVEDVLIGSCVTVSNITYTGPADASGMFDGTGTILGLDGGIILTTGEGSIAEGPDDDNNAGNNQGNAGDADLTALAGIATFDAVILEFDFVPQNADFQFNYIFASEEYPEWVNAGYNDVFGFFISGPGITGPYSSPGGFPDGSQNIALLPGTTTPVAIDNVNNGQSGTEPATGPCTNCAYYVDNSSGPAVQYDGYTTVLTAEATVTPCETYHIKLAVGDAGDGIYDSGVFLEEGSFSAGGEVTVDIQTSTIPPGIYEGCNDAWFIFRRVDLSDNSLPLTADFTISGTATPIDDYAGFPNTITIPAGEDSVFINLAVVLDFIPEGPETIVITMDDPPCTCLAPATAEVTILDNDIPLSVVTTGTTTICLGQSTGLTASPTGSQTPYTTGWDNGLPVGDNQTVSPTNTTTYTYTVTDNCGGQTVNSSETVTVIRPDFTIDDDEQCFDGNNFSFTNTGASGGTVTHFWDFGDSNTSTNENPSHTYAAAGDYTVTHNVIYTASNCTADASALITVFDEPILTVTVDQDVICDGGTDGAISTSIAGGTAAFSYLWSPGGATTSGITGLSVGGYSVVVTDANGCTDNGSGTIVQNDPLLPTAVCQDITVQLDASGNVTISATQVDNGSSDNCGIASLVVSPNAFTCAEIGGNAVTLTVTDVNGNVATCNATVTVEDNVDPTAVCQNITVQLDASGNASIVAADVDGGSSDNCSVTVSATPLTFTCANVGPNNVVLTATDGSGNTDNCTAVVTVEDNVDPTAVCQNATIQLDGAGNALVVPGDIDNGSSDNCAIAGLFVNPAAFTCANIGANSVTLTVTDVNGNTSTCTATVTILDNENPVAVCQNITVQLNAIGTASIVAADVDGGSTDNCSVSIAATPLNFTCADVGANTVVLTATDGSGNMDDCNATVTVEDNINPTAICQDVIVQLDANGNASIVAADVDNGSTDNCAIASLAVSPNTFTCANVGANTVTLTVTDVNGNVSTCTATVTVEDNVPPTAVCQDITIQLDATGNATISATDVDNGSADACGIASLVVNPNAFTCTEVGANTVMLTVTDVNGNVSTCTATVTVEDNIDPTAVCQDITVQLDASGNVTIVSADIDGGSTDNCSGFTVAASPNTFTCANLGVNTVTLTVTDANGNVSTCSADVTIEDNVDPIALCQNITVQLDASGNASIVAADVDGGSSDNCSVSISATPLAFTCANVGANTVVLTATDGSGNTASCNATVNVEDNVAPTALCQDITVQLDGSGNATISATDVDNGSADACGIASLVVNPNAFTCANVGANTVTLTVTDVNGNVSTCNATVTVEDNINPTAVCQNITVELDASGALTILSADIDGGSTDNCGVATLTINGGNTSQSFACSDVGTATVTLTVTDVNGNVSTCDADVTIEDNIDATAVCQDITVQLDANGDLTILAADVDGGSSDNCGATTITINGGNTSQDFGCSDVGTQTVTLTVTDSNGNVSTCDADVTIEDNIDPTAVCQDITIQLDASGNASISTVDIDNGSVDNCGIASITLDGGASTLNFDCSDVGTQTVTLTVTDVNGNVSTCTADVTIEDNVDPTAVCQDITVQLDANGDLTLLSADIDGGSTDNCGIASVTIDGGNTSQDFGCSDVGVNTITLTVTDVNGNVSTCDADVTIEDNIDPTAVCQDITIQLDASGNASISTVDIDNGSVDNCGIASITLDGGASSLSFDCSDVGTQTVTLTVTDVNGNVSTCTADVTIEDNVDPTAVCQDITIQLDASGNASISTVDIDNGSVDNCGIASVTLDGGASTLNFDCSDVGTQTVTLTVTDVNGNISTCTADVTIEDNVDPTAVCQDITIQLDASGNVTITGVDIDNGSSDNCGIASLVAGPNAFDCDDIGVNTVTLTVTDNNGNVSTCTADVTIEDNVNPDAVCQDITIQLDANGDATIVAADVDGGSSDNCAIDNMTVNPNVFDCNNLGTNLVVLTVTDVNGNVSTCTATVTVEDNVPPTPICQDIIAELDPTGNVVVAPGDVDNGSFDNCAIVSITLDPNTFVCADIGLNLVTLTVTDVAGNVSTCTANVDVQDNVLPSALCQDITVQLDAAGNATITPVMVDNGSADACGTVTPILVSPAAFDCSNVGVNIVTLTVEDSNGNTSTCESTVTIQDNINPDAVCQDITVQLDATGNATIVPADVDGGSSDNCAIDFMTVDPNSFTCVEEGPNTVTLTVTDVNGNVSTCTAVVTVENTVIPTVSCQDITIFLDAAGNASITAADVDGGSNAACGIASLTVDPSTFDCSNVGPNTVTLTGTDNSGNVSTCTAIVTVVDNIPPAAVCQDITVQLDATGNVSIVAADIDGGSTDNCAIASLSATPTDFGCDEVGSNSVVLTVTDVNGNASTCTAIVTVEDDVNPTIVCQDISVELDANGEVSITSIDIDNGSTDNCSSIGDGLTLNLSETDFDCTDLNTVTVTLTATDENGNSSTCTATVTILDNEAPTALCQDITVYLDAAGNASIVPADIDNGSFDNCSIVDLVVTPNTFTCSGVGPNPVSLTVTDQSGNVATCSSIVTVLDTISPTAVCQDITVQLDGSGNASIVATQINNGSADICGIASLVLDQTTFDCSEVGANTVTLTVTDLNGNVSTCSSSVELEDNVNPTAVCQDITVQLDASGNATIVAGDIDNGSSDNCSVASISSDITSFDCANVGTNIVTLTVTDVNGNVSTCTSTVTIEDNVPPTPVCQDITVQLDALGTAIITASQIDNGSSDNCAIATLAIDQTSFDCSEVGANTVMLTVTDVNGNVSTCDAVVTVEDNVAPIALCQDITIQLDATGNATITTADVDNGSSDNCAIASLVVDPNAFTCAEEGPNTVTLTVTDVNGNVSTCTSTVTVENNVAPNVFCQDITVYLDATGNVGIIADDVNGGSNASCGLASLTVTPDAFDCSNIGPNTVTLTAVDNSGNSSTCTAIVTVVDTVNPIAVCQDITVQLDANGDVTINAIDIDGGSTDNCGVATFTVDIGQTSTSFDCSDVGTNTVTLTVTDVNGNVSTCDAEVTVEDNINPTAVCQDITVQLSSGGVISINSVDIDGGSTDNCGIASVTVDGGSSNMNFDCTQVGDNTITLTVTDVNGNVSTCDAIVTVEDTISPTAICQDITIQLDANGEVTINSIDIDGGSFDNCGVASITVDGGNTTLDFDCTQVGTNTVTLTVTDVNGNVSTCDATVTVEDTVDPTAVCQDIIVQLDANGDLTITSADIDGGSTDNCGIASLTIDNGQLDLDFGCAEVGINTVTLTVTDVNGNVSTCDAEVTVEDNVNPTALCQDITVQLDANGEVVITSVDIDGGSTDNCTIASLDITPDTFDCTNFGTNSVLLTVTDNNGNVSTCIATITVADTIAPTAVCTDITVQLEADGTATIAAGDVDNGSFDNCAIQSLEIDIDSFDCSMVGPNTVTLTVTDVNGNVSTCTSTATVEDNVDPLLSCQDITVQLDANGQVSITAIDVDNGSTDACGIDNMSVDVTGFDCSNVGVNQVTLTVTDVNGNFDICQAVVTVLDTVPPTAVCQDITIQLDATGSATIVAADVDGGSTDNCAIDAIAIDQNTFDCTQVGDNIVTLTVVDVNGNTSTCEATVTIEDNVNPNANCDDITIYLDANGMASIQASDINAGSNANCGVDTVFVNPSEFTCAEVGNNTVTLTVVDNNGNISTCTANVEVLDTISPTALCQDLTIQLNTTGQTGFTIPEIDNGSFDNCAVAGLAVDQTTFDCSEVGDNTVTLTVTDVNANVSTCTSIITVQDTVAPIANCSAFVVQLDSIGQAVITTDDIDLNSSDNCAIASLALDQDNFDCSEVGTNTVTLTVTDVNGNVSTCTSIVIVEDNVPPIALCQDITIYLDASGQVSIVPADVDAGSTDNCAIDTMYVDVSTFNCATVASNTVVLTVEDNNGNTSTCTAEVIIEDNVAPEAVCQDATLYLDSLGQVFIASSDVDGGSTDNCVVDTIFLAQNNFSCDDLGTNIIELTVVDVNGNSDVCSAEITVLDTINPYWVGCPNDTIIVPDSSDCSPAVFWINPTPFDNCFVDANRTHGPGDSFSVGTTTVTYTAFDLSGNTALCVFDVTIEPSSVLVSITPQEGPCGYNLSCSGAADGEATANPAGGCLPYAYLWSDAAAQTTQTANGLDAGTYAVTVTDANGTTATETIVITEPDLLETDSITSPEYNGGANISCNGEFDGAANINVIGGSECVAYDFAWTGPNGFTSTSQNLTNLEAGTYVVTVSDASGCSYMDSITLVEPAPLDADSVLSDFNGSNISCAGVADGEIDLTVSGGATPYAFDWSNGATTEDIDSLTAGTYTYTITDANGCEITGSITLTEPVGLSSSYATSDYNGLQISCFGLSDGSIDLSVTDGTPPYSYLWNGGQVSEDLTNLPAGNFIVEITDVNGCIRTDIVTLTQPDSLQLMVINATTLGCSSLNQLGSVFVAADGGVPSYTYTWSDGQLGQLSDSLLAGDITAYVVDINGCQDSIVYTVGPQLPVVVEVLTYNVNCAGGLSGLIDVEVTQGQSPFSYDWSNGEISQDLSGIAAGTYTLTVIDSLGCSDTISVIITEPELLVMTVDTVIDATCSGVANGAITVQAQGGTAPYSYSWPSLGETGPSVSGLEAGIYEVQVSDANGCSWSLNVVVGQPASIDAAVSVVTEVSCNGLDDAEALVIASGGTAPYTYLWSNSDVDSLAEGLSAGNYSVTVMDAAGCDTTLSVTVDEPTLIDIAVDTIYNITCDGLTNGQAEVDIAGGTIPYTVSWSNGDAGYVANNLGAGTHTAYVTDGNGCVDSLQIAISEPDGMQLLQALTTNATCFNGEGGDATVIVEGGTEPYTYNWPFVGQSGNTATDLSAGEYVFVVSDANNCVYTDTVDITQPDEIIVTASSDTAVCPGNGVTISASATGGSGNFSYAWDNGLGLGASHFVSPSVVTTYSVQVTDQSGCPANVASVTVDIAELPVADFVSAADAPCVLPTTVDYTNTSTGATGFEWLLGNGTVSGDENPTATYDVAGSYTITLIASSGAGCSDTTTQVVNIDDVPTADFTIENAQGCAPLDVNFGNGSGTGLEYMWDFGDGTSSTAPNPTHYYEIPGDYEVTLIVSAIGDGCTDTLALGAAVSVYPSPIADFTMQQVIFPEPGSEYDFFNNTVGADVYNWDFGNGEQTDEYQPTYEYPSYGGYFVTLTAINEFGCADTSVQYLNVDLTTDLFVPNAMGIGEPGEAGVFLPKGTGIQDYHVWIFDNWGNLLWESTALVNGSPAESWDGQYKGKYVPQGSYVWKIDATFIDGEIWEGQEHSGGSTSNTGSIMVLY